jgi:hypothetical protein
MVVTVPCETMPALAARPMMSGPLVRANFRQERYLALQDV